MHRFTIAAMALALGLGACKEEQKPAELAAPTTTAAAPIKTAQSASPQEYYYQCGGNLVTFTLLEDGKADMRIANSAFALQQVRAASGAKYENTGNPATYFWSKGDEVLISLNGENLPYCTRTDKPVAEKAYRAQGSEPGWQAVVENGRLTLTLDYGEKQVNLPITSDAKTDDGRTVTAQEGQDTATLTLHYQPCSDSMSGERFAHTAQVNYGGKTYAGCGQSLIHDVTFRLNTLNSAEVISGSHITLVLGSDGRLSGNSGCNQYGGSYTLEGETLHIHPDLISTMRACIDEGLMQQEQAFLKLLPSMITARLEVGNVLLLSNNQQSSLAFSKER